MMRVREHDSPSGAGFQMSYGGDQDSTALLSFRCIGVRMSLLLSVVLILGLVFVCSEQNISIPITFSGLGGSLQVAQFTFGTNDREVEIAVMLFCDEHRILAHSCRVLLEEAIHQQSSNAPGLFSQDDIAKKMNRFHDAYQSALLAKVLLPTEESPSIPEATMVGYIVDNMDSQVSVQRLVFIHSCSVATLPSDSRNRILAGLLDSVQSSSLAAYNGLVISVLNYGVPLSDQFRTEYEQRIGGHSCRIVWLQVSTSIAQYEIPTLRVMSLLSKTLPEQVARHAQFLYLHTKGVSYVGRNQPIEDWRNMMLHFLVERADSCFYLLMSGQFDALGTNYRYHEALRPPHFDGNFWWASAAYLRSLAAPELDPLQQVNKYESELWLLRSLGGSLTKLEEVPRRVHNFHSSNISVDHYRDLYPRSRYAREEQ